jgi:hypothetical protein
VFIQSSNLALLKIINAKSSSGYNISRLKDRVIVLHIMVTWAEQVWTIWLNVDLINLARNTTCSNFHKQLQKWTVYWLKGLYTYQAWCLRRQRPTQASCQTLSVCPPHMVRAARLPRTHFQWPNPELQCVHAPNVRASTIAASSEVEQSRKHSVAWRGQAGAPRRRRARGVG